MPVDHRARMSTGRRRRLGPKVSVRRERWAVVGASPSSLGSFNRSLATGLRTHGIDVDVVRNLDPSSAGALLRGYDLVVVQHAEGACGAVGSDDDSDDRDGADGSAATDEEAAGEELLALLATLARLDVAVLSVVHAVPTHPTERQTRVLAAVVAGSDVLVTTSRAARERLLAAHDVDPGAVRLIPHAALEPGPVGQLGRPATPAQRPVVLTWGRPGAGKGIEWGIEAMAQLADLVPRPRYVVAGEVGRGSLDSDGLRYRELLEATTAALGLEDDVVFDDRPLDADRLQRLLGRADVVLLPYDSPEKETSGLLTHALAAGRPVVATRFPQAVGLLAAGAGLLVAERDAGAIAGAVRAVLTQPGLAQGMSGDAGGLAASLSWRSVTGRYLTAGRQVVRARRRAVVA